MEKVTKDMRFSKRERGDKIWWLDSLIDNGKRVYPAQFAFTFDKKKLYYMTADYPHNMTEDEVRIFDKENPQWAEYYAVRKNKQ